MELRGFTFTTKVVTLCHDTKSPYEIYIPTFYGYNFIARTMIIFTITISNKNMCKSGFIDEFEFVFVLMVVSGSISPLPDIFSLWWVMPQCQINIQPWIMTMNHKEVYGRCVRYTYFIIACDIIESLFHVVHLFQVVYKFFIGDQGTI